uniref:GGDEF domain-containing protein n=1 Tax=Vibrio salilacus TaxID=1323749 RepID=UPI001FE74B79
MNRNVCIGKALKPWPILVDHYKASFNLPQKSHSMRSLVLVQQFKQFSLRQLALIGSTVTVALFLLCFLAFKALWTYERALQASLDRQLFEVERINTVLAMEELDLRASLEDYAAWNAMAEQVMSPSQDFIDQSIGQHAFKTKMIDSIIIFDTNSSPVWTGYFDGSEVVNQSFMTLENSQTVERLLDKVSQSKTSAISSYIDYVSYQNDAYMIASSRICNSDAIHCEFGYLIFIRKIRPEFIAQRAILKQQSNIDVVTGIANRRFLYHQAKHFIDDLEYRYIAIILIDIDYFKPFNDNYGHMQGDGALTEVAQALQQTVTEYEHIVGRYGGEEFCAILAADKPVQLQPYLSLLVENVRQLNIEHLYSLCDNKVTVSAGASTAHIESYSELSRLFQQADEALYRAKHHGRNCAEIYSKPNTKAV